MMMKVMRRKRRKVTMMTVITITLRAKFWWRWQWPFPSPAPSHGQLLASKALSPASIQWPKAFSFPWEINVKVDLEDKIHLWKEVRLPGQVNLWVINIYQYYPAISLVWQANIENGNISKKWKKVMRIDIEGREKGQGQWWWGGRGRGGHLHLAHRGDFLSPSSVFVWDCWLPQ